MAVYLIADVDITDAAGYEEYRQRVPAVVEKYGGKYLARGGAIETLEGERRPKRLALLEFPSIDQARRFYDAEDYRPLKAMRQRTAKTSLLLVEGVVVR